MTTPAINSAYAIINDAYFDAGKKQEADDLTGEQLASGVRRLRDVIGSLLIRGLKVFTWEDVTVPLVAGQATYTLFPGGDVDMTSPLTVMQAFYLYTATNVRRPITVMSANDYFLLGQAGTLTSNRGPVSQYYIQKLVGQMKATFWLCPDTTEAANGEAHLFLRTRLPNPDNLTDNTEFTREWRIALRWSLALELATGQPQAVIDRCKEQAAIHVDALEAFDVEDAPTSIVPDSRSGVPGNFV